MADPPNDDRDEEREGSVATKKREKVEKARRFKVLFHNILSTFSISLKRKILEKTKRKTSKLPVLEGVGEFLRLMRQ